MTESTTLDEEAPEARSARPTSEVLGLVVAWCAETPGRLGELAFLPAGAPGEPRVFGRGPARPDDPHPRLAFVRQRPGGVEGTPAFELRRLSRVQLLVSSFGLEHLTLRNVGRCPLVFDGQAVDTACVPPGGIARLGQQLLLMCVRRSRVLAAVPDGYPVGPFGFADGIGIVGESAAIWDLRRQLALVGPRAGHVLLLGASGTGKELAARGLHALSDRSSRPLVARSAATIPESLVDAELFGNTKNYPNPGMADRPGLVGEANESTLFLDELSELPTSNQGHLLRVLDGGEYHRLGESVARRSNLRLVAATSRLASELKHDLLARFAFRIHVPDLASRREDIPLLVSHIVRSLGASDPALGRAFGGGDETAPPEVSLALCAQLLTLQYAANVRELERLLLKAFVEGGGEGLKNIDTVEALGPARSSSSSPGQDSGVSVDETAATLPATLTPEHIQAVLDQHNGRIEKAFRALGLKNRFALGRLIAKHGLEVRRKRS